MLLSTELHHSIEKIIPKIDTFISKLLIKTLLNISFQLLK